MFEPRDTDIIIAAFELGQLTPRLLRSNNRGKVDGIIAGIYHGDLGIIRNEDRSQRKLDVTGDNFFVRCMGECALDECGSLRQFLKYFAYGGFAYQGFGIVLYFYSKKYAAGFISFAFIICGLINTYMMFISMGAVFFAPNDICVHGWLNGLVMIVWCGCGISAFWGLALIVGVSIFAAKGGEE